MKIFFLINPSRRSPRGGWQEAAARHARRNGWTPRFGEVNRAATPSTDSLLDQALAEGCERIVVVGGDGSLHRVVNALAQRKKLKSTEVAVVPAGTCNDFARFIGLGRRRVEKAFRVACGGKIQAVDLGVMNSELFVNNAGFGRRPVSAEPPRKLRRMAPLRALRSFKPTTLRVRWNQGSIDGSFYMALICNAPYFSGGLHFSKNISLRDGLLDVFLMPVMPKWRILPLLALGRLGRPARSKRLITLRVPELEIEADSDIWPQADGELAIEGVRRVVFSVSPEKAMIVAQPSAPFA